MTEEQKQFERIEYVLVDKDSLQPYKTDKGEELRFPAQHEAAAAQQELPEDVREQLVIYRDVIEKGSQDA